MSIKAIHTLKTRLGLSDAEYRSLLIRIGGVASSKDLSPKAHSAVMATLQAMDRKQGQEPKTPQERKIWNLWLGTTNQIGLSKYLPLEKRTARYLASIIGKFGPVTMQGAMVRFNSLTVSQAQQAIEALRQRLAYEQRKIQS